MFIAPIAKLAYRGLINIGEVCARLESEPDVTGPS
jgi:hypothetical protein